MKTSVSIAYIVKDDKSGITAWLEEYPELITSGTDIEVIKKDLLNQLHQLLTVQRTQIERGLVTAIPRDLTQQVKDAKKVGEKLANMEDETPPDKKPEKVTK